MIDRSQFVPAAAPADCPWPFGYEATVPTEAYAVTILEHIPPFSSVLELGAGSCYVAAMMAQRAAHVVAVEVQPFPDDVRQRIPFNVSLIQADGCTFDSGAQFDRIVVSFLATRILPVWLKQLSDGGRLIVPLRSSGPSHGVWMYERRGNMLVLMDAIFYGSWTNEVHD